MQEGQDVKAGLELVCAVIGLLSVAGVFVPTLRGVCYELHMVGILLDLVETPFVQDVQYERFHSWF